jgi:predicted lipoprotein with Yx(FWY)xxD motif
MNLARKSSPSVVFAMLIGTGLLAGCMDDPAGITMPDPSGTSGSKSGTAGGSGDVDQAGAPSTSSAGSGGTDGHEQHEPMGGDASTSTGGTAGSAIGGSGGGTEPQPAAGAGGAEDTTEEGVHIPPACLFHSDPAPQAAGGSGGAPATPTVTQALSPFVGSYLADATGRTLYIYGNDVPGDCNTQPKSNCTADCLVSWPVFDAGARVLPPELTDAGFGTIARAEGGYQTTYMGWPLYYYKADLTLGQMTGQGKGKAWFVAESVLPNVVIMKSGTTKYLADASGHTLYVSAADQAATSDADPVSNCDQACLSVFEPFRLKNVSAVTSLEPLDFAVFERHGKSGLQLSYKGLPLYRAATDLKAGDMNGTAMSGFTAAAP